jgi:hypothetical protein
MKYGSMIVLAMLLVLVTGCVTPQGSRPSQSSTTAPAAATYDAAKLADAMEQSWGKAGSYSKPPRAASWFPSGTTYEVTAGKVVVSTPLFSKASNKSGAQMLARNTADAAITVYGFESVHVQVLARNGDLLASVSK